MSMLKRLPLLALLIGVTATFAAPATADTPRLQISKDALRASRKSALEERRRIAAERKIDQRRILAEQRAEKKRIRAQRTRGAHVGLVQAPIKVGQH